MRVPALCFALVIFATGAQAQKIDRIVISDPGIYQVETERIDDAPDTATGRFKTIRNVQLVQKAERIPGVRGLSFGFRFEILGQPQNAPVALRLVTRFPQEGLRNPKTGKLHLSSEADRTHLIGSSTNFRTYSFDETWEIVPGIWRLEFWYEGRLLAAQEFEVFIPELALTPEDHPGSAR